MGQLTYKKNGKLKSRKLIEHLFKKGKSFSSYPLKVLYDMVEDQDMSLKAGVTTGSKNFKKATDRNRVKRLLREAYRLQKLPLENLLKQQRKAMALFFIYSGKELPSFPLLKEKMGLILEKLFESLQEKKFD